MKGETVGGGRSTGGGATKSTVDRAVDALSSDFPLSREGYFGAVGKSGSENIREITADNPQAVFEEFGRQLTQGAKADPGVKLTSGTSYLHPDGTRVNVRPTSDSGSPAIDIKTTNPGLSSQKIHFEGNNNE